ncbi:MAG: glucosyltransferase domain-containing protein [Lachnospiraceae bacterium]|nr:glucosyltransferase domain-containing protein [Lachnospiraceae bacterium]
MSFIRKINELKRWSPVLAVNIAAGIFAYSLLIIHQLVNQIDGIWHGSVSYANGHELSNGRWFWRFVDRGRFFLSPDPVTSVIALSFFILGFILVLDIFDVRSRAVAILSSLMFTVNISILASLSYRYMSPTFAISCFLSILAAYIMIKCEKKALMFVSSTICISLAMGLYQADIGCTCLVLLLYVSLCLYKADKTFKEIGLFILRCLISLVIGMVLYYVLLNVNLWYYEVSLDSYNGTDSYGPVGMILNLPTSTVHAYSDFANYFRQVIARTNIFNGRIYKISFILLALCYAYGGLTMFKVKGSRIRAVLFALSLLLVPLAANAALLMAYNSVTSVQMTVPLSMSLPVLLCLASAIRLPEIKAAGIYKAVTAVTLSLLIYGNYIMTIYDQQAMYMGRQSLTELSREVISTLQTCNLYHPYYKYVFVGTPSDNPCFVKNFVFDEANRYAMVGTWSPDDTRWVVQSWQGFFTHEMGINIMVADDDKLREALEDETVRKMPIFPELGCCAMVNDVVVVKLSDNY